LHTQGRRFYGYKLHWLETGAPDPAAELAALVLEYGRRPLPRRATQLARKVLGGNARQ
jgi:hypothetical protein